MDFELEALDPVRPPPRATASDAPPWFVQEDLNLSRTTRSIPAPFQLRGYTSKPPLSENWPTSPPTIADTGRIETWQEST